jgi:hypothetical protein
MVAKVFLEHRQTILNSLQTALMTVKPLFNPLKPLFFCLFVQKAGRWCKYNLFMEADNFW